MLSAVAIGSPDWVGINDPVGHGEFHCRHEGVKAIQRSIDLARQLKASIVVVHAGHMNPDTGPEKKLRALIASGRRETDEYEEIFGRMIQARAESEAGFESVKKSMVELLSHA